jgi:SAM-dependent methyltransferase
MTSMTDRSEGAPRLFDQPSLWRAEVSLDFRLRGAERCAAASPTPGFPQLLDSIMAALTNRHAGVWLDVGGGLGGTASWIERAFGQRVVVTDTSAASMRAARRLFPSIDGAVADACALPVRSRSIEVAIASGLVSLLDDIDALMAELRRVVVDGGRLALTDLWSSTSGTHRSEPNTFWAVEDLAEVAARHGFALQHFAVAEVTTGWWSAAALDVNEEIARRHASHAAYPAWRRDLDHLDDALGAGHVMPAAVVLG